MVWWSNSKRFNNESEHDKYIGLVRNSDNGRNYKLLNKHLKFLKDGKSACGTAIRKYAPIHQKLESAEKRRESSRRFYSSLRNEKTNKAHGESGENNMQLQS